MNQLELLLQLSWSSALAASGVGEVATTAPAGEVRPSPAVELSTRSGEELSRSVAYLRDDSALEKLAGEEPRVPRNRLLSDRFFIAGGYGTLTASTEARLDSSTGLGASISFEELLGLDESTGAPQAHGRWRFSERWRLELEYFQLNRDSSKLLTGDIVWGGVTYPINTRVDARFDTQVLRLSCGYSFLKTQDKDFGVALGLHFTDYDIELSGSGGQSEGGAVLAPLPVLSTYGQVALTDRWSVDGRLDAFKLEYDPFKGHIYSLGINVNYQVWRGMVVGLSWRSLDIGISASNDDWEGEIKTHYQGPGLFLAASF